MQENLCQTCDKHFPLYNEKTGYPCKVCRSNSCCPKCSTCQGFLCTAQIKIPVKTAAQRKAEKLLEEALATDDLASKKRTREGNLASLLFKQKVEKRQEEERIIAKQKFEARQEEIAKSLAFADDNWNGQMGADREKVKKGVCVICKDKLTKKLSNECKRCDRFCCQKCIDFALDLCLICKRIREKYDYCSNCEENCIEISTGETMCELCILQSKGLWD